MATEIPNQAHMPENLRKQLALAVRGIQWSYAIFWSISATQPGVLEWGDGYYNGDIKTRKTVHAVELNADQLGLQRSDQLRELYESLSLGETNPQAKRPTAALSPEDLTDAEWYFLVCMSFVFNIGQGLPGKTLAKNQTFWLCNAHRADTKFFFRSLLAKSASIQTIVCFPHLGGVVELGTTEQVSEDLNLIQHIKTSFLGCPSSIVSAIANNIIEENLICEVLDHSNIHENGIDQLLDHPDVDTSSPNNSSNDFADNLLRDESNLVEDVDGEVSQMQSWPFMDDAISNCLNNSLSSDCVSQTYENPDTTVPLSDGNQDKNNTEKCNQQNQNLEGEHGDDVHYHSVLSNLLKSSHQLILGPYLRNGNRRSSFVRWKKDRLSNADRPITRNQQRLLKKVLFDVARMHEKFGLEANKQNDKSNCLSKQEDEIDQNHVLSERKRREKINDRFLILGSLVPSGGKVDKVSILDIAIEYLRELERKVEELQSYKDQMERESTTHNKTHDAIEMTSDNYGPNKTDNTKKVSTNKRKACDGSGNHRTSRSREALTDKIVVSITDKDVLIEMKCSWRESVMLEIMDVLNKLNLDSQSVQSSNNDGILSMTINAKCKGLKVASSTLIKQALNRVIRKMAEA